ncbi:hypothetical protein GKA01_20180 [Gluconobacter kanchanaburiensis NBRC 103587]|uniref:Uncharacterized protein n=1 Tax=Gluconobacter kanchanaburiensis NBRC 103587 TaxID=1307948 RepID=A0A511BAM2_9PROT|nr:hypothetical protein GKA01_20180 [Gluconobacter kanchanaburiensis NBRC 103587]
MGHTAGCSQKGQSGPKLDQITAQDTHTFPNIPVSLGVFRNEVRYPSDTPEVFRCEGLFYDEGAISQGLVRPFYGMRSE